VQFAVKYEADVMRYFDHYIPPELTEIVVDQTNLYAQQQIAKMPRPIQILPHQFPEYRRQGARKITD